MLHGPTGFLAPGSAEVNLCTFLLDRTHDAVLRIKHIDVATGRNHILVELDVIDIGIAPVHVGLTVIVNEHRGIDVLPMLLLPNQRFAKGVFKRSVGRVSHQHTDTMSVQWCIEIVLTIAFDSLDSPGTVLTRTPGEILQRSNGTMFSPVNHIGGRPQQPVIHKEAC